MPLSLLGFKLASGAQTSEELVCHFSRPTSRSQLTAKAHESLHTKSEDGEVVAKSDKRDGSSGKAGLASRTFLATQSTRVRVQPYTVLSDACIVCRAVQRTMHNDSPDPWHAPTQTPTLPVHLATTHR